MFCMHCGEELPDNAKFCPHCGNALTEESAVNAQPMTEESGQEQADSSVSQAETEGNETASTVREETSNNVALDEIIGKNQAYYLEEFGKIDRGEKTRFNWASFFLTIFHAAYRGIWKQWLSFMAVPIILYVICAAVIVLSMFGMFDSGTLPAILTGSVVSLVCAVLLLIWDIRFAKRFNRVYYDYTKRQQTEANPKKGPSWKRVIVSWIVVVVLAVVLSLASSAATMSMFRSMADSYDTDIYDDNEGYYSSSNGDNTFSDYNDNEFDDYSDFSYDDENSYYDDYSYDDYLDDTADYRNGNHNWQSAGWPYSVAGEWVSGYEADDLYVAFNSDGTGVMYQGDYTSEIVWCYEESYDGECGLSFADEASWVYYMFIAYSGEIILYDRVGNEYILERIGS